MERHSGISKFVFSLRNLTKIIPPIRSRCLVIHFRHLDDEKMDRLLHMIVEREGLRIDEAALEEIKKRAKGKSSYAINILQASSVISRKKFHTSLIKKEAVSEAVRMERMSKEDMDVEKLVDSAMKGENELMRDMLSSFYEMEVSSDSLLEMIKDVVRRKAEDRSLESGKAARMMLKISEVDLKLCECLNDRIHIEEMLTSFSFM